MRIRHPALGFSLLAALVLVLLPTTVVADHHLNGTWLLTVDLGGQGGEATVTLEESEKGQLSGKYSGALGEEEVTGTVNGSEVTLSFNSAQAGKIVYKGTVDGDTMEGTCEYGELGSGTFKGKRTDE